MSSKKNPLTITLTVATKLINQSNVNQYAQFSDSLGVKESGNNPKNYFSKVGKDQDIIWVGLVSSEAGESDPGDTVQIVVVFKQPSTTADNDILNEDCYYSSAGTVTGKAKKSASNTAVEPYLLVFSVTLAKTKIPTFYIIDPQLRIDNTSLIFN